MDMCYKEYAEYCMQRRRARLRLELKRKAHNWDLTVRWVIVPLLFLGVMMLCGFVDSM
jgi:hypothetical protein